MNQVELAKMLALMKTRKGQNVSVSWRRPVKTLKTCTDTVWKVVAATVRSGIDHENTADVKEKRAQGVAAQGLVWGEWAEFPFTIAHKGETYVRFYPPSGNARPQTTWFRNGKPVHYAEVECDLLASEKVKKNDDAPACFSIKLDNIISFT